MPDFLLNIDQQLFHFINHDMSNWFFDWLMPVLRNRFVWTPLYIFIFIFCLWKYKKHGLIILALLLLTFGLADFGSASIIKPYFNRLRPCNTPALDATIIERVDCGTGYSFPSSHASDHFAIAVFLSIVFYKRYKWVLPVSLFWAAAISFAQIYVGVHYPVDVLTGAVYGTLVGLLFGWIYKRHFAPVI